MKNISLLFLTCSLFVISFSGCGKKKEEPANKPFNIMAENEAKDIPLYQFDENEFFDNEEMAEFAFVDNDDEKCNAGAVGSMVLAKNDSNEKDYPFDDDFTLAYEDEDVKDSEFKVVNFDINKNSIRPDQKQNVSENTVAAKELVDQGKKLSVIGHTCQFGSATYNMALSEKRAKAIKDEMVKSGVSADKIQILGVGSESPLVVSDAKDKSIRVKELSPNRRAEIIPN